MKNRTNVDAVVDVLNQELIVKIDGWKINGDMSINPKIVSKAGFDDAEWDVYELGDEKVFQNGCYFRTEFNIPQVISGQRIEGELNLFVSINDLGELWVDGRYVDSWQWEKSLKLCEDAKPRKKIAVLIKAYSMHPMFVIQLNNAYLIPDQVESIKSVLDNLSLSLKTAQRLLSSDTYLKNDRLTVDFHVDKSTFDKGKRKSLYEKLQQLVLQLDTHALKNGEYEKFLTSAYSLKEKLEPYKNFVNEFTLYLASNAHLDAAWLWREAESIEAAKRTFDSTLKILERKKNLVFIQTSAAYYEWMEKYHPRIFKKIKTKVKEKNWEIAGGMWVEPDANLPDGESIGRQLLYGQKYFAEKFNKKAVVALNPDTFGFNWNYPQFLSKAGLKAFMTAKLVWNDTQVFPYLLFWWEAPDGSKILSYSFSEYANRIDDPFKMVDYTRQFEANTGFKDVLFLIGLGDHGGGPTWEMLQRIERLKKTWVFPKIEFISAENYFEKISANKTIDIPVWKDELYLEFHRGTYTSQAKIKKYNRDCEILLSNAEKFSVLAQTNEQLKIKKAWLNVLFNQFHDILPGTCIPAVLPDVFEKYEAAKRIAKFVLSKSVTKIIRTIDISKLPNGQPVVLFNALSFDRENIVSIDLPEDEKGMFTVFDTSGQEIPSQIIPKNELQNKIIFKAEVPSTGFSVYGIKKQKNSLRARSDLKIGKDVLENQFFEIKIDPKSGWISQIIDKRNQRKLLTGLGNQLQLLGNKPPLWKAWNINYTGEIYLPEYYGSEILEEGNVRIIYRSKYSFLRPGVRKAYPTEDFPTSFFYQDIILYAGVDMIEFRTEVDWWEDELILKTAFPLNIKGESAVYEIPNGTIRRSSDLSKPENKGKFEVPALRWADLSDENYGVSLINDSKYGYDTNRNVMRLTLLNSPTWPDPNANRGKNIINYWLYPHSGDWRSAQTIQKAYEVNNKILAVYTRRHKGELPVKYSFVRIKPENIILTALKFAEENTNTLICRFYESIGKETFTRITFPFKIFRALKTNILEEVNEEQLPISAKTITVKTKAYETVTIKIIIHEDS